MSSNFECFITIDGKKHTIIINKDINFVNFGDVYKQIQRINLKREVSLKTHVFEIFDFDTNSFKRLGDCHQLIRCLARIRISATFDRKERPISDRNERSVGKQLDTNSSAKPVITQPKSDNRFKNSFNPIEDIDGKQKSSSFKRSNTESRETVNSLPKKFKPTDGLQRKDTKEANNGFSSEGLVLEDNNRTNCQLCLKAFPSMSEAVKHINSFEHMRNRNEDNYKDIDKEFLTELRDKSDLNAVLSRKRELNRFKSKDKQRLIRHGIRLNDGFGPQSYLCLRCHQSFEDSKQMITHFKQFLELDSNSDNDSKTDTKSEKQFKTKRTKDKKSEPIVEFKIPEDIAQEVKQLIAQAVEVVPKSRHKFLLKCRLCDIIIKSVSKAFKHIRSEEHNKWKTEMPFKGIDRLIATENTNHSDIDIVLARTEALRQLSYTMKEDFIDHGIKVRDGLGANAFVCTKCNLLFDGQKSVENHLKTFTELKNSLLNRTTGVAEESEIQIDILSKLMQSDDQYIEELFRTEGIKYRKYDKEIRRQLADISGTLSDVYYSCIFCNTNFYCKETAIYHTNRPIHKKIRRGEHMSPIEAMFCLKSDRIDEFDVAFARMEALYRLDNKTKIDLRDKGIRLKDGIGADAYVCLKCNVSVDCQTIDSALFSLIRHTSSREHSKFDRH